MTTYNHAYSIAFEVSGATCSDGADVSAEDLRAALLRRVASLDSEGDLVWLEAVGAPYDTYKEE